MLFSLRKKELVMLKDDVSEKSGLCSVKVHLGKINNR